MMKTQDVRRKYLEFFKNRGHAMIPSAPLVPENDPTSLFTSSGMQPLVPYLLGQKHPSGTELVNSQPAVRVEDIEEIGDNRHTTFFEMLGNWSLGKYFKKEQLRYFFEFLTNRNEGLGLNPKNLYVTVFYGDPETGISKDNESVNIWKDLFKEKDIRASEVELITIENGSKIGMQNGRIFSYGVKKNWWSRSGVPSVMPAGEPGGPDSEVFYDFGLEHDKKFGDQCHPNCDCGRFIEVGNSVFMQYVKQADGTLKELGQKNVDFGGGLERLTAAVNNNPDVFSTNFFHDIIKSIENKFNVSYHASSDITRSMRIIADHLRASAMLISSDVVPSNKGQGYVLRKLLRRALYHISLLNNGIADKSAFPIVDLGGHEYPLRIKTWHEITKAIDEESEKFAPLLNDGTNKFTKYLEKLLEEGGWIPANEENLAQVAFDYYQSHGMPPEVLFEIVQSKLGFVLKMGRVTLNSFYKEFERLKDDHSNKSRTAGKGMFKGGLQDQSETTTRYHTATHLLHAALRKVLGNSVSQKGSNITAERLRFDFSYPNKMTNDQIAEVERLVNQKIAEDITVERLEMRKDEALKMGAMAFFPEKYPDLTSVYKIGDFSLELCGGPHVASTGAVGKFKIDKEESAGSGIRRVYATALFP